MQIRVQMMPVRRPDLYEPIVLAMLRARFRWRQATGEVTIEAGDR
jgi:hypothetical protein